MTSPPPEPATRSDGELLRRFLDTRDEAALSELVTRHAALVRGVCERWLGNTPDADDAFQATFLVLVRRGERILRPQSLAAWLYGVAQRIARRLRSDRGRASAVVKEADAMIDFDPLAEMATQHDVALFDAELARLPEKYRAPIVLHHLEGKSQREVAEELKLTEGAVDGLLKRGRSELRVRLARRGVVFGVTLAVLEKSHQALVASPPEPLIHATVKSILSFDPVLTPELPRTPSARLAQQEMTAMSLYHAGKVAAWTVAAGVLLGTAGVGISTARHDLSLGPVALIASELGDTETESGANVVLAAAAVLEDGQKLESENAGRLLPFGSVISNGTGTASSPEGEPAKDNLGSEFRALTPADFRPSKLSEDPIVKALDKQTEVSIVDTPLPKALQMISELHKFNVFVPDEPGNGLATDVTVNLEVDGISLRSVVKLMLEPHGLDYIIQDDVMKIVSRQAADNYHEMRNYNVGDIGNFDALIALVKDAVGGQWKKPGSDGPGGTIQWTPAGLAVRQNQRTLLAVEKFLDQFQKVQNSPQVAGTISGEGTGTVSSPESAPTKEQPRNNAKGDARLEATFSNNTFSGNVVATNQPHRGEKITIVGDIDLDGDGISDREKFHQIVRDAGMIIDEEIDDNGQWLGNQLSQDSKFLVIGTIPYQRGPTKSPARQRVDKIIGHLETLREHAKKQGVRTIKLNQLLEEIGQPPAKPFFATPSSQAHFQQAEPTTQRIGQALYDATEFAFVDSTLRDAMSYIQDTHKISILINEQELNEVGVSADSTINFELSGVELRNALDLMLEPLNLDYVIKNEVMMITTRSMAESPKYHELRIYNVEGLPPLIDKSLREKDDAPQKIEMAIKQAVGGDWDGEGNEFGTLQWTPAGLVVRTNQRMHAEIEDFLQQLRRADGQTE